ncbi:carboxypeptidase family protein [Dysgonomonas alginatilytica]|uniref:Carboxypeptidase family protein n=1 Tax=Dysgonomonas alginatilytica TaxID=1605892 RepID=A0A2V3PKG7_9BACT|nr:DUF3575 domain-containing protein [Dysgonomonas alginatilytica]PXV59435.1 carboxypeptidase family protein [Dysgonomonas alginatilytica]
MQSYKKNQNPQILWSCKSGRIFLCLLLLSLSIVTVSAQKQTITFEDTKLTIGKVFQTIEQQTDFNIAYNRSKLNVSKEIQLSKKTAPLNEILLESLAGTDHTYKINGKHIVITAKSGKDKLLTQTLRGTVLDDETGKPVALADVAVAGKTDLKTKTDEQGHFSIENIPLGSQTVAITVDGYKSRERGAELTASKPADMQIMLKATEAAEPATRIEEAMPVTTDNDAQQEIPADTIRQEIIPVIRTIEPEMLPLKKHPVFAQKTNLLYWATTTINFGAEVYLAKKWTAEASIGYNPWELSGRSSLRHWLVQPELRYWTCQSFEGHFFGLHGLYGKFNVGDIPLINALKDYTYRGNMYGAGLSYGYHFPLKGKWGLELTLGLGYVHLDYDKYSCKDCLELEGSYKRNYWGPTKAGISLIYLLE